MQMVADGVLEQGVAGAPKWVDSLTDLDLKSGAMDRIASSFAREDLSAAFTWVDECVSGGYAKSAFTEVARRLGTDPKAVMPQSIFKDSAVEGFAKELSREDPRSAAVWASTIGSEELRTSTLTDVARNWLRRDRAASEAWLPTRGLSAEAQQQAVEGGGRGNFGGRGRNVSF
ncbi:MAG: hypothetical protein ACI8T1_004141 [Verrucomicrobiales bacterium]|jgi:hypothetical protein